MSLKTSTLNYESIVRKEFDRLDSKGKIDRSKVYNALHYERIIKHYARALERGESRRDVFDPEIIQIVINSRFCNYTGLENIPQLGNPHIINIDDMISCGLVKIPLVIDFKTITKEDREKTFDLPIDELRELISNYLQSEYRLPNLSKTHLSDLAEFFLNSFIDPIYDNILWDDRFVKQIASIIGGRRYE